jgi:hypothetical protein
MSSTIETLSATLRRHPQGELLAKEMQALIDADIGILEEMGYRQPDPTPRTLMFFALTAAEVQTVQEALGAFDFFMSAVRSHPHHALILDASQARLAGVCAAYLQMLKSAVGTSAANRHELAKAVLNSLKKPV